jgi:hypothetical protein
MMSFLLARAVDIDIQVVVSLIIALFLISNFLSCFFQHQQGKYQEVVVSGDLSEGDLKRANAILSSFNVSRLFSLPLSSQ